MTALAVLQRSLAIVALGSAALLSAQQIPSGSPLSPAPAVPAPRSGLAGSAPVLPLHSGDPMAISAKNDPLLKLAQETAPVDLFRRIVAETIARSPSGEEAEANRDEAKASLDEAKAGRGPTVDLTITSYRVIGRNFGGNAENVIEAARPGHRTDNLLTIDQPLLDAGGASNRIKAAAARLRGADYDIEGATDRVALDTIAAWYDVFTYRSLVALASAFAGSQRELRGMVQERIDRGVSARADVTRVDSYIASAEARLARYRRLEQQADARFEALTGHPPPAGLARAPYAGVPMSRDLALLRATQNPTVESARAAADAADRDAKAARADTLPTISAGIDAGRYGALETPNDYDVRGRITARLRLFGGVAARARQAEARARSTNARADSISSDAGRDAEIAWSDVQALEEQRTALEATYLASRRSRDTIAERFRVSTGSLFDVIGAEDSYFETAGSYLQAVTELDAARYVLLSRTGMLLPTLGLAGPTAIATVPVSTAPVGKPVVGPKL